MVTTRRRAYEPGDCKPKRRKTDENNATVRVSRACRICAADEPRYLSVLNPCGHAVCRACAIKLKSHAVERHQTVKCSTCRSEGSFVTMIEELVDEKQQSKCESGEPTADPHQSHVREVADEERISASEEDRMIAESAAAWPMYAEALQKVVAATSASLEARKKIEELARAAAVAGSAADAAAKAELERRKAWLTFLETCFSLARMPSDEEFAQNEEATRSDSNTEAQLDAALEEAKADRDAAQAAAAPLFAAEQEAIKIKDEWKAKVEQVDNLIQRFKSENEDCATRGLRFSRACRACSSESPSLRSFFPACGHAVCRECADKATASESDTECPTCHQEGTAIPLFEELV